MKVDDFIIALAYFSIPTSLVISVCRFSRLHLISSIPRDLMGLGVLFALFVLLCGIGHLLRSLKVDDSPAFLVINILTCIISVTTAVYLIPVAPSLITNAEKSYQDLITLNEETAASKRKLFTFMNFLCHEIRNPLFAITSNIEFAQDMPMTPDLYESLTGINQSAHLMLRLVNDVLDLSKIESGKLQLEPQQFNLEEFFNNMSSTMGRQVMAKHQGQVQFVFHMAPNIPKIVQTDSTRLLQICYNVLSNSNKFTETGSISFTILVQDESLKSVQELNESAKQGTANNTYVNDQSEADVNGMASLENFSFSALGGKAKTNTTNSSTANSSVSSIAKLRTLMKALPSARSVGSHSDLSMDASTSNHDLEKGENKNEHTNNEGVGEEVEEEDMETVTLQLIFEDTGIGIEEEHLGRIFQPYTQSKLSDFRRHGGTGLGLSIIHKLLEMMEGTVSVTSKLGQGTKFVILLPVKIARSKHGQTGSSRGVGTMNIDINNPRPSKEEQDKDALSFAKLDENLMDMELDEIELSEKNDMVTPLSSASSLNLTSVMSRVRDRSNANGITPLSSSSSIDSTVQRINDGAISFTGMPPDRDGAATPVSGNKVYPVPRQQHRDGGQAQMPLFQTVGAPPLHHESGGGMAADASDASVASEATNPATNQAKPMFAIPPASLDTNPTPAPLFGISTPVSNEGERPAAPLFGTTAQASNAQPLFAMSTGPQQSPAQQSEGKEQAPALFSVAPGQQSAAPNSLFSMSAPVEQKAAPNSLFSMSAAPPPTASPLFATSPASGISSVTIPVGAAPISAVTTQPRARQLAKFNFPKNKNMVLVVDDNGVNRKLLGKMLAYFNVAYEAAENGKIAVDIMERSQNATGDESAPEFGLVLMDLCMPVMNGYDAIENIRNKLNLKDVPILALTASAMEDEKQKALRAGATEFATKPLLRPALHKKCQEYLIAEE